MTRASRTVSPATSPRTPPPRRRRPPPPPRGFFDLGRGGGRGAGASLLRRDHFDPLAFDPRVLRGFVHRFDGGARQVELAEIGGIQPRLEENRLAGTKAEEALHTVIADIH